MTSKRATSPSTFGTPLLESQRKKVKSSDEPNCFRSVLQESGLNLKNPPDKCIAAQETIHIIRNIKKNLQNDMNYPRNTAQFLADFINECNDMDIFKQYLYPNIVRIAEDSLEDHPINDSVVKILLSIPILQDKLIEFIFDKAIILATETKLGQWIRMILRCLSSLDSIVDTDKMSTNLINLLDITTEKMVRLEIITAIPDIVGDQEHNNIATEMSRILSEDHDLIPAILDCLSYLCLMDDQYLELQRKTLNILSTLSRCCYFPNFVKFLLMPGRMSESAYSESVQGLRNALGWSTSIAKPQEIATSQVLTAISMRNTMISSKVTANAWMKVVSSCKTSTEHKPIDVIILLILYSISEEKQRLVENLIRKQIKVNVLTEELLDEVFEKFKPILKDNLKNLIELTNSLLKTKSDPMVVSFASHIYTLMFSQLDECSQRIVAELLQLGLDNKQSVMNILIILNNVASKNMSLLKPQSLQMLTLLDRLDDLTLSEIRAVMNLVCGLAYSYENSVIRNDVHMIIRKELSSSSPKIKVQGILAGIHAVKYLMATHVDEDRTLDLPDDVSYSSVTHLAEGDLREAALIIELISRSTRQFPDMIAFFYDELSKIVQSASYINKNFLSWLTDAVTNDLQQNFIVDTLETNRIGNIKLSMQYGLNTESETDEVIAINVGGLALKSKDELAAGILSPLFQLVQTLHSKQDENLSSIDALLGCSVVMPDFDIDLIEDMGQMFVSNILDCLIHCANWFRELLNAFAGQNDDGLKTKILKRVLNIEEIENMIGQILIKSKVVYRPPVCVFNINKYSGGPSELKIVKPQNSKQKGTKKPGPDETVLPETLKSQATQTAVPLKTKIGIIHNIPLRPLNLKLLNLLNTDLTTENETEVDLTITALKFLLKHVNINLDKIMISRIKRVTFLSKENQCETYDPKEAAECAKAVSTVLPKIVTHLDFITSYIENNGIDNSQNERGNLFTSAIMEYLLCLEYIYNMLTTYFKWIGFKGHTALLKSSLRSLASSEESVVSMKDLLLNVAKYLQKHTKYCLQLSTAVSLVELLKIIQEHSESTAVLKLLRNMAKQFLSQQWRTCDGLPEKGLVFNQSIDRLAGIYFLKSEILALKTLTLDISNEIKILKTRSDVLASFKTFNKSNFPILYRNLGTALHDATKSRLGKGLTNEEHLELWKDVSTILKNMSEIAKTLETRNNLSAFFKKSLPVLRLFLTQGVPIIELEFKNETQEVLEIFKILQQTTRFLQSLCCHSRLKKDTVLMSKVPIMRQLLETLIYKVKAALAANNCSEAFWMGNLKNKNIHGEVIATQQSVESEEGLDDCDDLLPDDNNDESDDDELNPDENGFSDIV